MLRLSLVFTILFAWPLTALAQDRGAEALQIFEFDYDQKAAPVVNVPAKAETPAPAKKAAAPLKAEAPTPPKAPAQPKTAAPIPAKTPAPAKTALPTPAKVLPPNPVVTPAPAKVASPAKPVAAPPAKAEAPAPAKPAAPAKALAPTKAPTGKNSARTTAPLQSRIQNGILTIIGDSDQPSARYDEYPPDSRAEGINLSPADLPATTRIRVEKSNNRPDAAVSSAKRPPAASAARRPATGGAWSGSRPGSIHRFWQAAQNNWARYGATPHSRPPSRGPVRTAASGVIGHTSSGVPLQELTQFSGF
jgi:hypothetical protein